MKAAWYEARGAAQDVLTVGEMAIPTPQHGEVRIRIAASGINQGDIKKRNDYFKTGMRFPRVIPHSDGAGTIDAVGDAVSTSRIGERVWCFAAQSMRPFGTAAEYVVVPQDQAIPLPEDVPFEQGACFGIPGVTAHRSLHIGGPIHDRTVLIHGGAGAVGSCAVGLARHGGAKVIATVRSEDDEQVARGSGAHSVIRTDGVSTEEAIERIRASEPSGVNHIVEVAFHANIYINAEVLADGGTVASYATGKPDPQIPFWRLVFRGATLYFMGSDDFPMEAKQEAARALNEAIQDEWPGFKIDARFPLDAIIEAHESLEERRVKGRVMLCID